MPRARAKAPAARPTRCRSGARSYRPPTARCCAALTAASSRWRIRRTSPRPRACRSSSTMNTARSTGCSARRPARPGRPIRVAPPLPPAALQAALGRVPPNSSGVLSAGLTSTVTVSRVHARSIGYRWPWVGGLLRLSRARAEHCALCALLSPYPQRAYHGKTTLQ